MKLIFKIIISVFFLFFLYYLFIKPIGINKRVLEADRIIKNTLSEFKVETKDLLKEVHEFKKIRFRRVETISNTYIVLPEFPFDSFRSILEKKLYKKGLRIIGWEKNIKEKTYRLDIGLGNIKFYTLILKAIKREISKVILPFKKAKVAIVIDDFGYSMANIDSWLSFEKPVTFSILPNLDYSTQIANLANSWGREIILHLPLEPKNKELERQEKFTILTSMSPKEILRILDTAIKSIPYLKGVSNHQGSLATEDRRVMGIILNELKKRNLYFLDSLVTNKSVCREIAQELNLNFLQRDIFLDNIDDIEYIKGQLLKLARVAQTKGFAIGIGHVHTKTLEALKEFYPLLEEKGIEFVYLSDLLK